MFAPMRTAQTISMPRCFHPHVVRALRDLPEIEGRRPKSGAIRSVTKAIRNGWIERLYVNATTPRQMRVAAYKTMNKLIQAGALKKASDMPCVDCGHDLVKNDFGERLIRHELDHVNGYDVQNCLNVQPVCAKCHAIRENARGTRNWRPRAERAAMGEDAAKALNPRTINAGIAAGGEDFERVRRVIYAALTACDGNLKRLQRHSNAPFWLVRRWVSAAGLLWARKNWEMNSRPPAERVVVPDMLPFDEHYRPERRKLPEPTVAD